MRRAQQAAVLVRGLYNEMPYLAEFVDHYCWLGFDRVYYINTHGDAGKVAAALPPALRRRVVVLDFDNAAADWQEAVLDAACARIDEEWLLSVDMDEFLYLPAGRIADYLEAVPPDVTRVRFMWALFLATTWSPTSVRGIARDESRASHSFKTLVRRRAVVRFGIHDVTTSDGGLLIAPQSPFEGARLLHFACRGLLDLLSRVIGRRYNNDKSGAQQEEALVRFLRDPTLPIAQYPFRFNMLRVQLTAPTIATPLDVWSGEGRLVARDALWRTVRRKLATVGVNWPGRGVAEMEMERRFVVSERLLRDLPAPHFYQLHLQQGLSHIKSTRAYVDSLQTEGRA